MSFLKCFAVRLPLLLLCSGTILSGTAPLAAQAAPQEIGANAGSAYSAWNELLRDAARMGLAAAARNSTGRDGLSGSGGMSAGAGMQQTPGGGMRGGSGGSLNLNSLFQLAGDASRGLSGSGHSGMGSALGVIPMLSQLTRGGVQLPVGSSYGSFRITYQSPLNFAGMNGSSLAMRGYGSGAATYNSPHMRSGRIDFSAAAMMGVGSNGASGGPGGGMGQGGQGGPGGRGGPGNHAGANQSDPSASVSLHLSF